MSALVRNEHQRAPAVGPFCANRRQARGFKRGYHLGRQRRVAIRRDANEVPIKRDRSVHIRAVGHAKQGCEVLGRACRAHSSARRWEIADNPLERATGSGVETPMAHCGTPSFY